MAGEENTKRQFTRSNQWALFQPIGLARKARVYLDIDGLFANCEQRLKHLDNKDYDAFYGLDMSKDTVHPEYLSVALFLNSLFSLYGYDENGKLNAKLIFLTGRPERTRALSALWLKANFPFLDVSTSIVAQMMRCRPDKDLRVGFKAKWDLMRESVRAHINAEEKDTDFFYLDDDYRNIRYCADRMQYEFGLYLHGLVVGAGRLPSATALTTDQLGNGIAMSSVLNNKDEA